MGADVSFASGRYGSFRTLSRHAIQSRRETIAFYLAPLVIGTPLNLYHAWGIANLPKGLAVYNTRYRILVATPKNEPTGTTAISN